ncbi:hypothetical protein BDZ89DRAFT_642865 [Hymenopellis radicata]|nr:hypothetical protein BDZ89DRAFT_642865 [Hymenopellis radicata]
MLVPTGSSRYTFKIIRLHLQDHSIRVVATKLPLTIQIPLHIDHSAKVAVLIIHGTLDDVVPFSDGLKLLELTPHGQMVKSGILWDRLTVLTWITTGSYEAERWCAVIEKCLNT